MAIATVGLISLSTLQRRDYKPRIASYQITPPSRMLILLTGITGESVSTLFATNLMPDLMLGLPYLAYILFSA